MFLEIVFPKYQRATAVDIEASYKSMPEKSYDQYDKEYTSTQKTQLEIIGKMQKKNPLHQKARQKQ